MLLNLLQKIFEQEKCHGMEGQYDFANLQRGLWEFHRHQYDISYREYLVQNNRMKTVGGDKHRRAVRFHAGQRDNLYQLLQ